MSNPRIAFVGLGHMGGGMAGRLLAARFPLAVFSRDSSKAASLVSAGARLAASPGDAARDADVIISMVADDDASRAIWQGNNGALAAARPGAVFIECSTLTVDWVKELAALASKQGCELLDAPVTGTRGPAAAGQLNFFVGGNAATLERMQPVFAPMAKSVTHVGPTGAGAMLKLVNNFVCGVQVTALAEALVMVERSGLDRQQALALLTEGAPGSPLVKVVATRMTAADYTPQFSLKLMTKDLVYAVREASKLSLELTSATAALQRFQGGIAAGNGDQDMAALIESIRG
jgi:3-hydroxyisobutyrate dehydrogenase